MGYCVCLIDLSTFREISANLNGEKTCGNINLLKMFFGLLNCVEYFTEERKEIMTFNSPRRIYPPRSLREKQKASQIEKLQ
jgi:hypothetical protein